MRKKNKSPINVAMTYGDFYRKNIPLKKINIPILKQIAKHNHLKSAGNKQVLIDRIQETFYKNNMANLIQKIFRGYLVRTFFIKREPYTICVNDTDFYTMEPLSEISFPFLYIYKEDKIAYGFHLSSLATYIYQTGSLSEIKNPYNRAIISGDIIKHICKLFHISCIFFPLKTKEYSNVVLNTSVRRTRRRALTNDLYPTPAMELYQQRVRQLTEIREKPIEERVRILFTEIDSLGNYTVSQWFFEIRTVNNYLRFYRTLFNIWYYYSQMTEEVRQKICMCGDPFENILAFSENVSLENVQENCLRVMENMVFMGIDDEFRKLGAFHALTALTVVCLNARQTMYWLYESLIIM